MSIKQSSTTKACSTFGGNALPDGGADHISTPYSPNLNLIERLWRFLKKMSYTIGTMSGLLISRERFLKVFATIKQYRLRAKVSYDP
jgi:hypothetical protein